MPFIIFIKGFLIGLLASIPLGPIGVLCIQRTLSKSHKAGFISGLGATAADTIFAVAAFFSLSVITSFIESNAMLVKVIGGISVLIVGMTIFLKNPVVQIRRNRAGKGSNLWSDFISVFFLTLTNPAFILIFVALFAAFGISHDGLPLRDGMTMILGVMGGSASWWFVLTFAISLLRKKFRPRHLLLLNRISGAIIVILGAATILSIFIQIPLDNPAFVNEILF